MAARKGLPREATSVRLTPEARKLWTLMAAEGALLAETDRPAAGWNQVSTRGWDSLEDQRPKVSSRLSKRASRLNGVARLLASMMLT